MVPHARNRPRSRANDLGSPPVPADFAVEQPTQKELLVRETIATARGVRAIESAWPGQPPRQTHQQNSRRGRGRYNTRNRSMRYPGPRQDDAPPNPPHSPPKPRNQAPAVGEMQNAPRPRTGPVLLSLPTATERIAANAQKAAAMRSAKREKRREEKQKRQSIRNNYPVEENSSLGNDPSEPTRRYEPDERTASMPNYHIESNRQSPSLPPTPHLSPPLPQPQPSPLPRVQQPILVRDDWRNWPEISVKVGPDIPLKFGTWDMYCLFEEYGEVESVELLTSKGGTRDGWGRVKFSRVLRPFWKENSITYQWKNAPCQLKTKLEEPRRSFQTESPINKDKKYPEKFTFKLMKMDFGFMIKPNTMVTMYTTNETDDVTFGVDLYRKHVDIMFSVYLAKEDIPPDSSLSDSSEERALEEGSQGRRETYRFRVPFSHLGKVIEQGSELSDRYRTLLITLKSPPLFWRKLHQVVNSHDLEHPTNYWTSWDMWFRQTGITFDPHRRSKLPVSLRQTLPIIDTGRWTTYRFSFDLESKGVDLFQEMISALSDFNVSTEIQDLEITTDRPEPIWGSLEVKRNSGLVSSFSGDLSEILTPLLPYPIRYQLEVCISKNCLNEYNLTTEFIDGLRQLPDDQVISILEFVAEKGARIYDPMEIFRLDKISEGTVALKKKKALPGYCQLIRKASITPSTVVYTTPTVEITNRVMRHYSQHSDRFLRVQFVDEESQGRINSTDKKTMHEIFTRIMVAMENGIQIGDRNFEFLAFGNSQIREHGAYFFASTYGTTAADIRAWMGDFTDIKIVAKHAARLGQCFSTTRAINGVQVDIREIKDIEYPENDSNFSDGVGKISDFLSQMIAVELKLPPEQPPPSCVQFRLGGCKGVLTVWPDVEGREVFIRPSQRKFQATHNTLEVIRVSKPAGAALNRQLIIVLSGLGTQDEVFVLKLKEMMAKLEDAMHDSSVALSYLCKTIDVSQFTLDLAEMVRNKFMDAREPFVMSLLGLWRAWSIKNLKEKARITLEKGAFVLGVVDETGILEGYYNDETEGDSPKETKGKKRAALPEIFLQIPDPDKPGEFKVIEELCVIARNPSLHPGDIRTVRAVNVPQLRHLRNVVVFPNKGDRDLPNMLSGGDLDGDDYIVIWDPELTFGVINHKSMDFTPLEPRELGRDVTVSDIKKFFVNYMKNDKLGTIANSHLAWADLNDEGVKSTECIHLATLHSDAVDYVKTGQPAEMPRDLRPKKYPHFMEKNPDKTRKSRKILGRLYDMVEKIDFVPSYELQFDDRILNAYTLSEDLLVEARMVKAEYDAAMNRIMAQHDIHTEFEVYSTFVMHHSAASKDYKFHEEIASFRDGLVDSFREVVFRRVGHREDKNLGPFVAAMYTITKQELDTALEAKEARAKKDKGKKRVCTTEEGYPKPVPDDDGVKMPLISFPWIFWKTLGRLANREYPFTYIDGTSDGILGQYDEYEYVTVPDTRRSAPAGRGTETNSRRDTTATDEIPETPTYTSTTP